MRKVNDYVVVTNAVVEDIRKKITEWIDFSNSAFCDTQERKASAHGFIDRLEKMLAAAEANKLTRDEFTWFMCLM